MILGSNGLQCKLSAVDSVGGSADFFAARQGKFAELDMRVSQRVCKQVLEEDQELVKDIASIIKCLAWLLGLSLAWFNQGREQNLQDLKSFEGIIRYKEQTVDR